MEKDPTRRYQSASQMLRHIYRVQQNPSTVFQKQSLSRSTTADVAIKSSSEKSESTDKSDATVQNSKTGGAIPVNTKKTISSTAQHQKANVRAAQFPEKQKSQSAINQKGKKRESSESVPFSVVILICLVFCILAAVGFFFLFTFLRGAKTSEASAFTSVIHDSIHIIRSIGTEMRSL
jgi:cobalamin biosynthesis Mg chelatase CobN